MHPEIAKTLVKQRRDELTRHTAESRQTRQAGSGWLSRHLPRSPGRLAAWCDPADPRAVSRLRSVPRRELAPVRRLPAGPSGKPR